MRTLFLMDVMCYINNKLLLNYYYTLDLFLIMLYGMGNITGAACEAMRMDVSLAITEEMYYRLIQFL